MFKYVRTYIRTDFVTYVRTGIGRAYKAEHIVAFHLDCDENQPRIVLANDREFLVHFQKHSPKAGMLCYPQELRTYVRTYAIRGGYICSVSLGQMLHIPGATIAT